MMLNIIDKIYSSSHFTTLLIGAIGFLIVIFIIVLVMGIKDAKKNKDIVIEEKEEKDITFDDSPKEPLEVKEDVTLEMSTITKDLEDFKKGLEEELQRDSEEDNHVKVHLEDEAVDEMDKTVFMEAIQEANSEPVEDDESKIEDEFIDLIGSGSNDDESEIEAEVIEAPEEPEKPEEKKDIVTPVIDPELDEEKVPLSLDELDKTLVLGSLDITKDEDEEDIIKDNTMEIELPKKNVDFEEKTVEEKPIDNEERKKREQMLDDYLNTTQALSLDEINKKLEEYEKDNF